MVMWLVFAAVCVFVVFGCVVAYDSVDDRREGERRDRRLAITAARWPESTNTVLSHVTADGEVVEYPIIRGESLVTLATTLGEIAALPEVAA